MADITYEVGSIRPVDKTDEFFYDVMLTDAGLSDKYKPISISDLSVNSRSTVVYDLWRSCHGGTKKVFVMRGTQRQLANMLWDVYNGVPPTTDSMRAMIDPK